jgi:hypothetical protein
LGEFHPLDGARLFATLPAPLSSILTFLIALVRRFHLGLKRIPPPIHTTVGKETTSERPPTSPPNALE